MPINSRPAHPGGARPYFRSNRAAAESGAIQTAGLSWPVLRPEDSSTDRGRAQIVAQERVLQSPGTPHFDVVEFRLLDPLRPAELCSIPLARDGMNPEASSLVLFGVHTLETAHGFLFLLVRQLFV